MEKCKHNYIKWSTEKLDHRNDVLTEKCKKCGHTKVALIDKRNKRNHRRGNYEGL